MAGDVPTEALQQRSIPELARSMAAGELSALALTECLLARVEDYNPALHAFITLMPHTARTQAAESEGRIRRGISHSPLDGIPLALKDNIDIGGVKTTCASLRLERHLPARDAMAVAQLRRAGGVILGKTNLDEFALHATGKVSVLGPVPNPWDAQHIAGGSSSGSAAAVSLGLAVAALGTDTGGSVRIPASFCGVVGFKPTRGVISTDGVWPVSRSLDHVGIIARNVADVAVLFEALRGTADPLPLGRSALHAPKAVDGRHLRIGIPLDGIWYDTSSEVEVAVRGAIATLSRLGLDVLEVQLPPMDDACWANTILARAEAWTFHRSTFGEEFLGYRPESVKLLRAGERIGEEEYRAALRKQQEFRKAYDTLFQQVDVLALPTVPMTAPRHDDEFAGDALVRFTAPYNLVGLPALSVPCGWDSHCLPVGLQFVGPAGNDAQLLHTAGLYEQARRSG